MWIQSFLPLARKSHIPHWNKLTDFIVSKVYLSHFCVLWAAAIESNFFFFLCIPKFSITFFPFLSFVFIYSLFLCISFLQFALYSWYIPFSLSSLPSICVFLTPLICSMSLSLLLLDHSLSLLTLLFYISHAIAWNLQRRRIILYAGWGFLSGTFLMFLQVFGCWTNPASTCSFSLQFHSNFRFSCSIVLVLGYICIDIFLIWTPLCQHIKICHIFKYVCLEGLTSHYKFSLLVRSKQSKIFSIPPP